MSRLFASLLLSVSLCAILLPFASGQIALGSGVQVQANTSVDVTYLGGHFAHYELENAATVLLADVHVFPLLRRYPIEYMLVGFSYVNAEGLPQVGYDMTFTQETTPVDVYVRPPPLIPSWVQYLNTHSSLELVACFTNSIQNWYATFPLRSYNESSATVEIQMPYGGAYVVLAGPPTAPKYALFDFAFDTPAVDTTQVNLPAGLVLHWTSQQAHTALLHLAATSEQQQQAAAGYTGYRYITASLLDENEGDASILLTWTYDNDVIQDAGLEPTALALFIFNTVRKNAVQTAIIFFIN